MDNVVCVKVNDRKRGAVFVITWGRVFDPIDPRSLFEALGHGLRLNGLLDIKSMQLCSSLAEGAAETYFYEALISVAHKPIPFGRERYPRWARKMRQAIKLGKESYIITDPNRKSRRQSKKNS
jgi:hypothetical protein